MRAVYRDQVSFLLDLLPHVFEDKRFALKGGTAINLFHRNLPRLSIDIDICYLPNEDRNTSFKNIHQILSLIKTTLEKKLSIKVHPNGLLNGKKEVKSWR